MRDKTDDLIAAGIAALRAQEGIPPAERFDRMVAAGLIRPDGKLRHVEESEDEEVPISQLIAESAPPEQMLSELSAEAFLKVLDLVEHPPTPGRQLRDAIDRYRRVATLKGRVGGDLGHVLKKLAEVRVLRDMLHDVVRSDVAANQYTEEELAELKELDRKAQEGELEGKGTSLEAMMALLLTRSSPEVDHDKIARLLRSGRAGAPKGTQAHAEVDHEKLREIFASHEPDAGFADALELASGESGAQAAALSALAALTPDQLAMVESWLPAAKAEDIAEVRRHLALARKLG